MQSKQTDSWARQETDPIGRDGRAAIAAIVTAGALIAFVVFQLIN